MNFMQFLDVIYAKKNCVKAGFRDPLEEAQLTKTFMLILHLLFSSSGLQHSFACLEEKQMQN